MEVEKSSDMSRLSVTDNRRGIMTHIKISKLEKDPLVSGVPNISLIGLGTFIKIENT